MKAMVLCGGKGTRLRPYTHSVPKPMLLLGRKPILEYTVEHLKRDGFKDLVFTVGHLKEQVMDYFQDGRKWGVNIEYSIEDAELGTAGSVLNARKFLENEQDFLVIMGDQLTALNYGSIAKFHEKHSPLATIALKRFGIPFQFGSVEVNDRNEVIGFEEKPIIQKLVNSGVYAFKQEAFEYFPEKGDFALNVFPAMMSKKKKLLGYPFDEYWVDVGSIHDYEHVNQIMSLLELVRH